MPKKIIFVRHGETTHNIHKKYMNWANDVGTLSEKGQKEANEVGLRLKQFDIHAMYASDLRRAKETASIIAKHITIEPIHTQGLRERDLGIFGDLTFDEIASRWPEAAIEFRSNADIDWNDLEGESIRDVHKRFQKFMEEIESKHTDEVVLFVAHSGVIYTILKDLYHFFPQDSWVDIEHTSLTILEKSGDSYILQAFNKID
jgi:2,3-bisphosphoglycerate-dependent phosphoglycerate mutase